MKKILKRSGLFISFVVICCLCFAMISYAGWVNVCPEDGTGGLYALSSDDDSFAVQFNATKDFTCIGLNIAQCSSPEGTIVFELFSWKNSYAETIDRTNNAPIFTKTFENFTEGRVWIDGFSFGPGEYVAYFTTPNSAEGIAFWTRVNATEGIVRLYGNDVARPGEAPDVYVLTYPVEPDVANGETISGPLSPVEAPAATPEPTPEATPEPTPEATVPPTETGDTSSSMWVILALASAIMLCVIFVKKVNRKNV